MHKDVYALEKIQRQVTKLIPVLKRKKTTIWRSFKVLNFTTLETRCISGELIQAFMITKGFYDVRTCHFFLRLEAHIAPEDIL